MSRDWARLGAALKAARKEHSLRQEDAAEQLGLKRGAVANIESGSISRVTRTLREYARVVGWTADSVEAVLDGGEPTVATAPPPSAPDLPGDLSSRVIQALAEGELLGSRVMHVQGPEGEVTATIVVRGETDMPPEDLQRELVAWLSAGPILRTPSGFGSEERASDDASGTSA